MAIKTKILYIDDEEINVELFSINFSWDYEVVTAFSGYEGLVMLDKHKDIKAIISDMKMPGMNGVEFITQAKEKYPDKKYFILTGYDINDEIQKALKENLILQYFRKPFNMDEIVKGLNQAMAEA